MNYLGRVIGNLKGLYSGINGATLTGAIDVVVVEQEDGTYKCSPFHVRFGKLGVLRSREKIVDIEINGESVPVRMKLGDSGEAFFVQEVDGDDLDYEFLATSPIPASPQLSDSDNRVTKNETEESADDKDLSKQSILESAATISDGEDENSGTAIVEQQIPLGPSNNKGFEDSKNNRKRRRKRRRNQGSKGNIVVEALGLENEQTESGETMFKMDEELSGLQDALEEAAASQTMERNRSYHRDFYSDTEVDATSTPRNSRPSTPIQSDSEYEFSKVQDAKKVDDEEVGKWPWGELPSTGSNTPAVTPMALEPVSHRSGNHAKSSDDNPVSSDDENSGATGRSENKSLLGGMFSFMTKRHSSGGGGAAGGGANAAVDSSISGIYLDDLNLDSMDPEVAALYFPNFGKDSSVKREQDEDVESGKGSSLPQSPAPGSSPKSSNLSVYMEDEKKKQGSDSQPKFEAISICGSSLGLFEQSQLTFDELIENPEVILNTPPESIVVKIDGKMVPWAAALPQLLSTTFFKRPIPSAVRDKLVTQYTKGKEDGLLGASEGVQIQRSNSVTSNSSKEGGKKGYSWFPWRRSQNPGMENEHQDHPDYPGTTEGGVVLDTTPSPVSQNSSPSSPLSNQSPTSFQMNNKPVGKESSSSSDESEGTGGQTELKRSSRTSTPQPIAPPSSSPRPVPPPLNIAAAAMVAEKYKKSLRLTTEQIQKLRLQYGRNEAVFSVTTAYQGTTVARCHIYLWRFDDRVVVSDIDGTITKSDVLGHILPIIGNDWAQSGVAQLFTQIQDNGYKMLYLSARAIGQASITRDYLRSIRQGDVTLPDGPLLLNPTSLMSALHREVIEKKPEEFKIACLRDIQNLFPTNPFYAGYGNRINDVWAYRAVDIAIPRIFTINHKGELRHALTSTFQSSYTSLVELAEYIFPPYKTVPSRSEVRIELAPRFSFSAMDGYSDFEFWRAPILDLPGLAGTTPTHTSKVKTTTTTTPEKKLARSQSAAV